MLVRIPAQTLVLAWYLDLTDKITVTAARIRKIDGARVRSSAKSPENRKINNAGDEKLGEIREE